MNNNPGIKIDVKTDTREVKKYARRMGDRMKDLSPALKLCAGVMHQSKLRTFRKNGMNPHWPALSPMTMARRAGKGASQGRGQLWVSGRLYMSIQAYIKTNQMIWGTDDDRATVLHDGGQARAPENWTKREFVTIPARKFVRIYHWDHQKMTKIINDYMIYESGRSGA